ncbi:hypothetical protein ACFYMW_37205 [Streptomyces sp. NPDC006692]|uniref:hypothetical protein n=1 Tax=unclassified Streptomyces TaxID=2593676 RepID=UPI003691A071
MGLDVVLPVSTGARTGCNVTDSVPGQVLTVVNCAVQIAAWAQTALFLAGFTSAVRKT